MLNEYSGVWSPSTSITASHLLCKRLTPRALLSHHTHHIAFLQWTCFDIPLRERPKKRKPFFLLIFLMRSHDSSPVKRFFKNGVCSFRCNNSVKIRARSALLLLESSLHTFPSLLRSRPTVD
ncbi:hypothetical protein TNIN_346411 [Trichonephila inaurata madagascariensis]|uniref:Uncharacterized protein n=1 Tax=Trichonephila inaurata madagascariensis TaxID=2747483 RepID=A0A8X7C1R1_9ARAC|nr:hypothetical protein TNIN_346411 [Trichonephila inaurata madagascariensis]